MKGGLLIALGMIAAGLVALCTAPADAMVVAVDLGNEFVKVALVKPGQSFQIATNVASKRKTPTMVAYYEGERLFGADAEALMARRPRQVFSNPHRTLGRNWTHPLVGNYANGSYFASKLAVNDRNGIDFVVPPGSMKGRAGGLASISAEQEVFIPAEELTAQLLAHTKEFAEAHAGNVKSRDAVITVPSYYTQSERLALLDAAEIAGFTVLQLIDENAAVGIHYGIDRVNDNGTHYMLCYNMGHEATQVTLFAYDAYNVSKKTIGQGRVVAKAWDTQLGGRWFDMALIEHVANDFNAAKGSKLPAEAKGDIRNVPAAMVKIKKNVVKAKEILSANEKYPLSFDGLVNDIDFRTEVSRTLLESAAEKLGLWARVTSVIDDVLVQSGLSLREIDVIEIVGGGVRMPRVQALLSEYLVNASATSEGGVVPQLGTHLNGDESSALGAVFAAANRSAAFRVRPVGMIDGFPFPIGVRLSHLDPTIVVSAASAAATSVDDSTTTTADAAEASASTAAASTTPKAWTKRSSVFRAYNPLDNTKKISFTADHDLKATMFYETATPQGSGAPLLPPGTSRLIAVYNITGLDAIMSNETNAALGAPKVSISFRLDQNGIATLLKAEATQEEEVLVPEPTPRPKPSMSPKPSKNTISKNSTDSNNTASNSTEEQEGDDASDAEKKEEAAGDETKTTTEDADAASGEEEGAAAADADASADSNATATEGGEGENATTTTPTAPKMKLVKRTHRYALTVTLDVDSMTEAGHVRSMSSTEIASSIDRLRRLKIADDEKRLLEGAKNALEAYIYATREKRDVAGEDLEALTTEDERELMSSSLMDAEEWLYADGEAADLATYRSKLRDLRGVCDPALQRLEEASERPSLIERAREAVTFSVDIIGGWNKTHPQITVNETEMAAEAVSNFSTWLEAVIVEQEGLKGYETPVLTREIVAAKTKPMMDILQRLSKKPKPAPSMPPKPKTSSSGSGSSSKDGKGKSKSKKSSEKSSSKKSDGKKPAPGSSKTTKKSQQQEKEEAKKEEEKVAAEVDDESLYEDEDADYEQFGAGGAEDGGDDAENTEQAPEGEDSTEGGEDAAAEEGEGGAEKTTTDEAEEEAVPSGKKASNDGEL